MKTILINPPQNTKYPQPPLGVASLAAVLEQKDHQVEIMDANALQLSEREIANKVKGAGRKLPHMAMKTSRGCPYKCIYVSKQIFEHKFRGQRQERTVEYSRDFEEFFSSKPL